MEKKTLSVKRINLVCLSLLIVAAVFAFAYDYPKNNEYLQSLPEEKRSGAAIGYLVGFVFGTIVIGGGVTGICVIMLCISTVWLHKKPSTAPVVIGIVAKFLSVLPLYLFRESAFDLLSLFFYGFTIIFASLSAVMDILRLIKNKKDA